MTAYQEVLMYLKEYGLYDLILPLIIFYILIYIALSKVKFLSLGDEKKTEKFRKLLSFVFTLLVVLPYAAYPEKYKAIGLALQTLQPISVFLLVTTMILIVWQFLGGDFNVHSWTGFFILFFIITSFVAYFFKLFNLQINNPIFAWIYNLINSGIWKQIFTPAGISIMIIVVLFVIMIGLMTDWSFLPSKKEMEENTKKALNDVKITFVPENKK